MIVNGRFRFEQGRENLQILFCPFHWHIFTTLKKTCKLWNNRQFSIFAIVLFGIFVLVFRTKTKAKEAIRNVHMSEP